jgi:hypothetical protein
MQTSVRIYRDTDIKKHQLVTALTKKGYTNVIVTKYDARTRPFCWVLQCDQIPYRRLGADAAIALHNIQNMPVIF